MCGLIAGIFRERVKSNLVDAALSSIAHRGPDGVGTWYSKDKTWMLGHVRLSIIGLENGRQPIGNHSGEVQLVINGELYGYQDIRKNLLAEGHKFSTESDSEIALHLYLQSGVHSLRQLRGEFAGVIADQRNGIMIGFRDRFGIKPLFYTVHNNEVLFASEIKALLALGVESKWNRQSVFEEAFNCRSHENTLFEGIYCIPPGHYAVAQKGNVKLYPYWDLEFPAAENLSQDDRSEQDIIDGFREVLSDAIKERMVADVEVASYLSGGIDSCAVLGLAQQQTNRKIRAFTLAFDDVLYDESSLAKQQAELVGSSYNVIPVSSRDIADNYSDGVWHAETVFLNGHGVAKYILSEAVRDAGIKVVFTGEGADEMLGGYPPFRRDVLLYNNAGQDEATVKRLLDDMYQSNKATRGLLTSDKEPPAELESVRQRLGWIPSWIEVFAAMGKSTTELFRKDFTESLSGTDPYGLTLDRLPLIERLSGRDPLNQSLYLWSRIVLPNFILTLLGDRMEMAHSLEGRLPFLDHKVAEYAANIPINMKVRGMREKHVLREAARDVIIEDVYNREKHPFTSPPAQQDDDPMFALFEDVLNSSALDDQPVYDPQFSRQLLKDLRNSAPEERFLKEGMVQRIVSATIMHDRFGMSG
jgi:asparagine synthase (glutamine-hydrolysing)